MGIRIVGRLASAVVLLAMAASVVVATPAAAQVPAVVISEIFYNPPGPDEGDQFVELHNAGDVAVDLSGWGFADGVDVIFAAGTQIPAGGRYVIAADAAAFQASFGQAPDAVFGGSLSNGGERLALVTGADVLVDDLTYNDDAPWPVEADGDGDSLQLLDLDSDNADPLSWGIGDPSPGSTNDGASFPATAIPTFAAGRGVYDTTIFEEITSATPGATIHYTVNGRAPTSSSPQWSGQRSISSANGAMQHIRAIAIAPGRTASDEVSATYLFPQALPFSAGMDELATVSLSYDAGEYIRCENFASDCPRNRVSIDMLDPAGPGFGVTGAVAPFGSSSLFLDKNHLRLYFDSEWGVSNLEYPVFDGFGRGFIEPTDTFDKLELKGQGYEGYDPESPFPYPFFISDRYWKDTMLDMGSLHPHGRVVNVFVNGEYWGVFDLRERFDAKFAASYSEHPADDYEFIRADESAWNKALDVKQGNGNLWPDLKNNSWSEVRSFVDPRQLIRHEITTSVQDHQNPQGNSGGENEYRFVAIPGEQVSIINYSDNDVSFGQDPNNNDRYGTRFWWVPERGASNAQFQWSIRFAQQSNEFRAIALEETERAFCGDGAMTLERSLARFDDAVATMRLAIAGEQWRWGGNSNDFESAIARGRARLASGIPKLHQGWADDDLFNGCAGVSIESGEGLVITEMQYNPQPEVQGGVSIDGDLFEFIELHNTTNRAMNIAGFTFLNGVDHTFDSNTVIEPGGYFVLASSADRFAQRYGFAPDATYRGRLNDGGETITLVNTSAGVVDTVTWDDNAPWPNAADGDGPSLALIDPAGDNALSDAWAPSSVIGGDPGEANVTIAAGDVDGSGQVNSADVQTILAHLAGRAPDPFYAAVADVDNSGSINLLDALLVARQAGR